MMSLFFVPHIVGGVPICVSPAAKKKKTHTTKKSQLRAFVVQNRGSAKEVL